VNKTLYRLSFFKYLKEKIKETLSISGRCKGDIFLNPALKSGQEILREGKADDHILAAIKYFASRKGYGREYIDLGAGFGAISTEVWDYFDKMSLREEDEGLRMILKVNMKLKSQKPHWEICDDIPIGKKALIRSDNMGQLKPYLSYKGNVIIFQNKIEGEEISALPYHDIYLYFHFLWRKTTDF
jgi:hypothetical protein